MAITFDNVGTFNGTVSALSCRVLLTATAGACCVLGMRTNRQFSLSAVHVGATQFTRKTSLAIPRTELWVLTAPASGVLTISCEVVTGGSPQNMAVIAVTYVGHSTTTDPFGEAFAATATAAAGGSSALSISTTAADLAVWFIGANLQAAESLNVGGAGGTVRATATHTTVGKLVLYDGSGTNLAVASVSNTALATRTYAMVGMHLIASADGAATINASMSATDAPDVFAATIQNRISAQLSATDALDTFAATAKVIVSGRLSATESIADTFASTAQVRVSGRLSATDVADTFLASAQNRVSGRLSATDVADAFVASSYVVVSGRLSATDAPDIFLAVGTPATRNATFSATDAPDSFAATAAVRVTAFMSATDAPDTFLATGAALVTGTVTFTDPADTFVASATVIAVSVSAAEVVAVDSSAGHGDRLNDYLPAGEDFWDAREAYLRSLQPEIEAEPGPQIFPEPDATVEPVQPANRLNEFRDERLDAITALNAATTLLELRAAGLRLRLINRRIFAQKELLLRTARREADALQWLADAPKRLRARRLARMRKQLALLETARELLHLQDHS